MYASQSRLFDFRPISLYDREVLSSFSKAWEFESSEFVFSTLFLWQPSCNTAYTIEDDILLIRLTCGSGKYDEFILPPMTRNETLDYRRPLNLAIRSFEASGKPLLIRSITERFREKMEQAMPGKFIFEREPSNDEYIYQSQSLITLSGKKLHAKRNHINQFRSLYAFEYEPYRVQAHLDECLALNRLWHKSKDQSEKLMSREMEACSRALTYADELGLSGGVIRIDGKIQAFTLGEQITSEMALIQMEKANADISGLYAMINQQFAEHTWSQVPYINREEDMGLEGLRKAKMSYRPIRMIEKYAARLA